MLGHHGTDVGEATVRRKLTTIFCADGAAFSAHMARDEDATYMRLSRVRDIMQEKFSQHEGRQINTWGDAVIAEFSSVVEAVRCGVAIQDAIGAENRMHDSGTQLQFRIGINLGDVMVDGEDLVGDGVNVASRLESLADPGGVVVSGTVFDLTHKHLTVEFDSLGFQTVKDLDEPVMAYRVIMPGRNAPEEPEPEDDAVESSRFIRTGERVDGLWNWLMVQPKGVRRAAGFIGFFLALNVLFTGIATPWFIFPSIPFGLYILRHVRRTRKHPPL